METKIIGIVRAVLCLCIFFLTASGVFSAPASETATRTVTVIGEGTVQTIPDVATVSIGVEAVDQDVRTALSASRETIRTIVEALTDLGVAKEDMQTANYSFDFDRSAAMDVSSSRNTNLGRPVYRVNNMLTVTIRNLELTGEIIDAAVLAGANQMWGVEFSIQEPGPVMREATELAVAATRERARYLSELNNLSVGRLLSMSETNSGVSPYFAAKSIGGGVNPGVISYTVLLTAVFELIQ